MKYKLIATDFDGTLNFSNNSVSQNARDMIAAYRKAGGIFTIASGRNRASIEVAMDMSGVADDVPVISSQGSVVSMVRSRKVLREAILPKEVVAAAIDIFSGFALQLYSGENIYRTRKVSWFADMYTRVTGVEPVYVEDILSHNSNVSKLLIAEFTDKFKERLTEFRRLFPNEVSMDFTGDTMLEMYSSEAGKGKALRFLAEDYYNLSASEVVSFGDSRNDISMIEYAGLGVAMANAEDVVKQSANYVCESNDNDGVAKTISRIISVI